MVVLFEMVVVGSGFIVMVVVFVCDWLYLFVLEMFIKLKVNVLDVVVEVVIVVVVFVLELIVWFDLLLMV